MWKKKLRIGKEEAESANRAVSSSMDYIQLHCVRVDAFFSKVII